MSIIIDSIDFHEVSLAKIENVDVNVSINIVSSSIYNRLSNFVWLKQISQVFIKIQECELKSPYTIEGDTVVIDKFFWLSVEMKMYSKKSHVEITETKISGGRFQITDVGSFKMSKCRIEDNIPKISAQVEIDYRSVSRENDYCNPKINFAKIFPDLQGESRNVGSRSLVTWTPQSILSLKNIKNFIIGNCTIKQTIAERIIDVDNVSATISSVNFLKNYYIASVTHVMLLPVACVRC